MADLNKAADATAREFLSGIYKKVREFDVTLARNAILDCLYAANMTGLTRHTFYQRRERDTEFAEAWDEALTAFEEELTMRVVQTALEMGTGKWVPCLDDKTGQPILDDDFEQVFRFETGNVDPRVLNKLLSLRMSSADGPAQTNVQVNNPTTVTTPRNKPRLVRPSVVSDDQHDTIEAQVVQETPQETGGASDA